MSDTKTTRSDRADGTVPALVGLHYRSRMHVRTTDERECYICHGRGRVKKSGGFAGSKWYTCKKCGGTGSIPAANAPDHRP